MRNIIAILLLVLGFTGCAAVGVPHTDDPMEKISYAYALMNQNRPIPAERLANEALDIFQRRDDMKGIAESHMFFGQLYKLHQNYNKSIKHSQEAADIYLNIGNYTQLSKVQFALANAYVSVDKNKACYLYPKSIDSFNRGTVENPGESFVINPNFTSFEEMVNEFSEKYCSNGA